MIRIEGLCEEEMLGIIEEHQRLTERGYTPCTTTKQAINARLRAAYIAGMTGRLPEGKDWQKAAERYFETPEQRAAREEYERENAICPWTGRRKKVAHGERS